MMTVQMTDSDLVVELEQTYRSGQVPFWPGVTGRIVPVTGGTMHYVEVGTPTGEPVLLLHKLGGWAADWRHVAELLADEYRVLVVDMPGHGGSTLTKEETWAHPITESSIALREFLDALGLERAHLMGSSLGGVVSTLFASQTPERVRTLSLVAVSLTAVHTLERTLQNDRAFRESFTADWFPLAVPIPADLDDDERARMHEGNASRTRAGRWARASERGFGLTGIEHVLPDVQAPTLLVNAIDAAYRRYEDTAVRLLRDVRVETIDVPGMFPHQNAPDQVAALWRTFVEDAT
jgi:pimeloyl-ACP methyl ester carboxylesterase